MDPEKNKPTRQSRQLTQFLAKRDFSKSTRNPRYLCIIEFGRPRYFLVQNAGESQAKGGPVEDLCYIFNEDEVMRERKRPRGQGDTHPRGTEGTLF